MLGLPLDIVITIIDELATDQQTLTSCSLSHRSVTPICQKHLFKSVVMNLNTTKRNHNEMLNEILCHNPQLGTFVQYLSIKVNPRSTVFDTFPSILHLLPNVNDLIITTETFQYVSWIALPVNLCESLLTLLSPVIKSLSILGISGFPISYIGHCSNLRDLTFACYVMPSELIFTTVHAPLPPPPIHSFKALKILHTCTCEGPGRLLTHLASTSALSRLRSLKCWINRPEDVDAVQAAVAVAHPYLEELYVGVSRGAFRATICTRSDMFILLGSYNRLDLSGLAALRSLQISMLMTGNRAAVYQWIGDALETLSPPMAMRRVMLKLFGGFMGDAEDAAAWSRVDGLLAGERGGAVESVEIVWSNVRVLDAAHAEFLRLWMPGLVKQNRLVVYQQTRVVFPRDMEADVSGSGVFPVRYFVSFAY